MLHQSKAAGARALYQAKGVELGIHAAQADVIDATNVAAAERFREKAKRYEEEPRAIETAARQEEAKVGRSRLAVSLPSQLITLTLVLDGVAGLAGGLLSERWLSRHLAALVGFAAGTLLAAVFLDVLPETLAMSGPGAFTWAFAGFVLLALVEWVLGLQRRRAQDDTLPAALLVSDALHNVGDGAAIAAAFLLSTRVGLGVAIAVIAHEVPQEIGDYALLRRAGWQKARALLALAGVQLTAALGALGVVVATGLSRRVMGPVLSLAAGTFLYIGATDLLPELKQGRSFGERCERMIGFLTGIGTILLAGTVELG